MTVPFDCLKECVAIRLAPKALAERMTIHGAGHTWPGGLQYLPERRVGRTSRDVSANEVIWEFFKRHPMPQ